MKTSICHRIRGLPYHWAGDRFRNAAASDEREKNMNKVKVDLVDNVEMAILKSNPPKLSIKASGRVSTAGWSAPELVPYVYVQAPPDGIYDFGFVAQPPPPERIVAQVVSPISPSLVLEKMPAGLLGVRIHAASNIKEALLEGSKKSQ
jgi:hypothetical protein